MNITTGGPHILLFERDQQLASLLSSELQLAGYECHVARTAVEVFDAIARYSIRLLLVNLAQAAASRREFWVALDTQRRGRGVQVLTFLCMNVAGYGPKDPEDVPQSVTIDIEVDGMIGLMNLVEVVRDRLPSAATSTVPTMPRMMNTPASSPTASVPGPSIPPSSGSVSGTQFGSIPPSNASSYQPAIRSGISPTGPQPAAMNFPASPPQPSPAPTYNITISPTPEQANGGMNQAAYSERIRAVLYPNQRTWSTNAPSSPEVRTFQENQIQQGPIMNAPRQEPSMPPYTQLQSAQSQSSQSQNGVDPNNRGTNESGLDQLTRMIQQYQSSSAGTQGPQQQPPITPMQQPPPSGPVPFSGSPPQQFVPPLNGSQTGIPQQPATSNQSPGNITQYGVTPQSVVPPENMPLNTQTMRAAPIQDLPSERQFGPELQASRPGSPVQQPSGPIPPLASIITPPMQPGAASAPLPTIQASPAREPSRPLRSGELKDGSSVPTETLGGTTRRSSQDQETIVPLKRPGPGKRPSGMTESQEETLIGIMESLPSMPPPTQGQSQAAQAQVLNGRAMRTLGSVLLAGHLVPEDRLDVAQNIQRMLRGVDLNYQLGEILLMFKLLTPDQLMAASLVSYGMVSTQQISALGRVRQELHSVGLDYDLENLLILFRILTPEQIREAKSAWQS
jgi:hypothetical protein